MSLRRALFLLLALAVSLVAVAGTSPAGATDNPTYTAPPPATTITTPGPTTTEPVEAAVDVQPARTRLAITGSDATGLAVLGGVLLLVGAGVLAVRRRAGAPVA